MATITPQMVGWRIGDSYYAEESGTKTDINLSLNMRTERSLLFTFYHLRISHIGNVRTIPVGRHCLIDSMVRLTQNQMVQQNMFIKA